MMNPRLKLFLPLLVFVLMALVFWRGLSLDPNEMPSALIDKAVPVFTLTTLEKPDEQVKQSDLEGPYLLNVWATWCITCRQEHPYLLKLAQQGVTIYGINYKDDVSKAQQWLKDLGNPYRFSVVDNDGRLGLDLGVFGAPETYVVDKKGVIRYKLVGELNDQVWTETIEPLYRQYQ